MGNCSTDRVDPIYLNHTKQEVQRHFIALAKLEHFERRYPTLQKQAIDDVDKIIRASLALIDSKEQEMTRQRMRDIEAIRQDPRQMKRVEKRKISLEDYVGLPASQEGFRKYREKVCQKFLLIKKQLEDNMQMTFQSLKEDIEDDFITFSEKDGIDPNYVSQSALKWRVNNRERCKEIILDIQQKFRDGLTHDYFRNKLKNIVLPEDVKQLGKRKSSVQQIALLQTDEEGLPTINSDRMMNPGCFSCWPS